MRNYLYGTLAQSVTLAFLVAGLTLIWVWPVAEEKSIQQNSASKLDGERLTIQRMEQQLGATRAVIERYHHNLEEIRTFRQTYLSNREARMVGISDFLEERARARRVGLDEVRYQTLPGKDRALEIYAVELPLVGRYRDIRAFIDDIEASDIFLVITQLALEDDSGRQGAVRMQLSLATYFEGGGP